MKRIRSVAICTSSLLFLLAPEAHARAGLPSWAYHPPGVRPIWSSLFVPCGEYGSFSFELDSSAKAAACLPGEKGDCSPLAARVYSFPPGPVSFAALPSSSTWIPCADGACFRPVSEIGPETPWVAVIDWNNLHGWSIGWAIEHLGRAPLREVRPVLFDLDDPALLPLSDLGTTDVHLLKQLCEVAEIADDPRHSPPLVINMSLGRPQLADDPADARSCAPGTLSCQIARVLNHLACTGKECPDPPLSLRTIPVVAAGNDRRRQFPAYLPGVVAAGSLQLGRYATTGKASPSWETPTYPEKAQAWMPGYGICLERGPGKEQWPAPPGTSYAAAVLSGWLAFALGLGPVDDVLSQDIWFPFSEKGTTSLAHGNRLYRSSPGIRRFLGLLLHPEPGPCDVTTARLRQPVEIEMERVDLTPGEIDQLAGDAKTPAPTDRPCVPCIGIDTSRPPEERLAKSDATSLVIANMVPTEESTLFAGYPTLAGTPGVTLEEIYLRRGEELFRLLPPRSTDSDSFALSGVSIPPGEQPSLIYVYRQDGRRLRVSVPILVRAPAPE